MCTEFLQLRIGLPFAARGHEQLSQHLQDKAAEIFFYKCRCARYCVGSLCNHRWPVLITVGVSLLIGFVPYVPGHSPLFSQIDSHGRMPS
jgi:hypothetical protein